jgi:DNA-binding MarR family transcriptional regulator
MNIPSKPSVTAVDSEVEYRRLVELARRLLAWRRKRDELFPTAEFADPEWDHLLDLFVESSRGRAVNITSDAIAAAVPSSTAIRTITAMVEQGVVLKSRDPEDGRQVLVSLSAEAHDKVERWLRMVDREFPAPV